MSELKKVQWLEQFTGVELTVPSAGKARVEALRESREKIDSETLSFESKRLAQAEALAKVRAKLVPLKKTSQELLSTKIAAGPLEGKSFLAVEGEQIDEIDPDTLRLLTAKGKLTINDLLPGDIGGKIALLVRDIHLLADQLSNATYDNNGKPDSLFSDPEIQAEFWTPVKLERIYPDGLITDKFSETQQMLDATNELYLQMVEQKKLAGQLTPEVDLLSEVIATGKDLVSFAGSLVGAFGPGSEGLKLAKDILDSTSTLLEASDGIYQQLKNSDFGGAASGAIELAGTLTGTILSLSGVDKSVVANVTAGFKAGSQAVILGKALYSYSSGEGTLDDAMGVMANLLATALSTGAANATDSAVADGLTIAAKAAPSALKSAGLASGPLVKAVREGDFPTMVSTLGTITKEVLDNLPGLEKLKGTIDTSINVVAAGTTMAYKVAVNARRGDLGSALKTVIADVGSSLENVLSLAGIDDDTASKVISIYQGSATVGKAIQSLVAKPNDPLAAVSTLTGGIEQALGACGDPAFAKLGKALTVAVEKLVATEDIADKIAIGKYDEAVSLLIEGLSKGVDDVMTLAIPDSDEDDGGEESDDSSGDESGEGTESNEQPGDEPQKRTLKPGKGKQPAESIAELAKRLKAEGVTVDPKKVEQQTEKLAKQLEDEENERARDEAEAMLAQVTLDLSSMSEAQKVGAEASNIDNLIADLLRDRMIFKIATQIAQGGAAFLAKFVPGLGAVSAGIKLAAQLVVASQRAKQVDAWVKSQKDLKAAQSPLSPAAANFVKNQASQLAHYSAQAAFAAAELAGEITKLAGPAAPIGAAISAIAGASATAETALMERKDRVDIEIAWKVTQKALRNPKNRQLGLEARKLNPTLAKFSIAWGAVVLKDPLARNAMRACGLTEASLNNDSTDTDKVVQFLEIFYEDDKSLYRDPSIPPPEWIPADPEVSLLWWGRFRKLADSGGGLTLTEAGQLEGLLGQLLATQEEVDGSADKVGEAQAMFVAARGVLENAFKGLGNEVPLLPPPSEPIEEAMDEHAKNVIRLSGLYVQIAEGYKACVPTLKVPGSTPPDENPSVKAVRALLDGLSKNAVALADAAKEEASGVETSKVEFRSVVESLRRKAEAKSKTAPKETTN